MKTLFVLRHAKSSWNEPELADYDRPLNDRGSDAAPIMGKIMRENEFCPDVILSSPAERARQTAGLVKESARFEAEVRFDERIYEASPLSLRQVISEVEDRFSSLMLVGHNPGIEGFIRYLTGRSESMPTAALASIELDIDSWKEILAGTGHLLGVLRPKDVTKGKAAFPEGF